MDTRNVPARLMTEQVYVFGQIIEKGAIATVDGRPQIFIIPKNAQIKKLEPIK